MISGAVVIPLPLVFNGALNVSVRFSKNRKLTTESGNQVSLIFLKKRFPREAGKSFTVVHAWY
jgi:hypothetical protein